MKTILHIDFNSYFATVEQQANPRLRGKPVAVTGGDRLKRTVIGAASVEAKKFGVKTGMQIWEAQKLCPQIILVNGDSEKYLEVTKRFLNILKDYTDKLEVFSIDEAFLEVPSQHLRGVHKVTPNLTPEVNLAQQIKSRIREEIGEWMKCSIGISYNKLMAKLASNLQKPDGLVIIPSQEEAIKILDKIELDEICGIGPRIKKRLFNTGIFNFYQLRKIPLELLLASFKSYGQTLFNMARGLDFSEVVPFFEKEEVKSIGHRHTIFHDTNDLVEIKQLLLKLTELIARKLRAKNLVGKTVSCWYRNALDLFHLRGEIRESPGSHPGGVFSGNSMQTTITYTSDGLEIFKASWKIFHQIWNKEPIRMIGVSISNLKPKNPENLTFLEENLRQQKIIKALDKINNKFGEFTLQRGILLNTSKIVRKPNSFLADRRFKL